MSSHLPPVPFKYKYLRIAYLFIYASISLCDRVLFEMLMVLHIYLDHSYEDEDKHHPDVIYIYYSLELEFNMKIMDGIVRIMVTVKSVER